MKKSLVMVLLVIALVLAISNSALAEDNSYSETAIEDINFSTSVSDIMPLRYSLISTITADLYIEGNEAECFGEVTAQKTVYKIELTMTLQKYSNNKWTTWAEWNDCKYNTNFFYLKKYAPIGSGSYRVQVEATVTDYDGEEETATAISGTRP